MKTDLFQSCGHCWVFQICWHIECSTSTVSSFRIWNSSTGIPSPPLALFVVMLPKAHLTPHSRMSGSRWVITPLWLSGSWRFFLHSSFVYSCHLFFIPSASVRSIPFLSFTFPSPWRALWGPNYFFPKILFCRSCDKSYGPATVPLGIYPREFKIYVPTKTCKRIPMATLFLLNKK